MSVMTSAHEPRELEDFYKRWSCEVYRFCRLFLGDAAEAERILPQAFAAFYRQTELLPMGGKVRARLFALALQAMQASRSGLEKAPGISALESCILRLECKQRAVFIARSVFGMEWPEAASLTESTIHDARRSWLQAMLRLQELLPRDFFGG